MSNFIDYKAVKQAVSMVQILERYGLMTQLRRSGDSLSGACPLHGGHNNTQFRVSVSKNCWNCFGDCKRGGNIIDFVSLKEGVGFREAALLIADWFGISKPVHSARKSGESPAPLAPEAIAPRNVEEPKVTAEEGENKPLGFELKNLDASHPYLEERKLTAETIQTFGVGFCSKGTMAGRIAVPIHNIHGELVAYVGRWPGTPPEGEGKYRLPKGFRSGLELFNIHRAAAENQEEAVVLVEGFFDCMWLWQLGIRRVAALMGSTLSDTQEKHILSFVPLTGRILLLTDGDDAGIHCGELMLARLGASRFTRWVRIPEGKQPTDYGPNDLRRLLGDETA